MPYSIIHNHPDCPKESGESGKDQVGGHAVVKDSDNELIGCHKTHKSAMDQITALNIAEAEMKSKENEIELREVDRKPPEFMKKNAQRGLDNLRKAGPGLTDKTKREARDMAAGRPISISKIVRIAAWHKRHIVDLDREKTNPQDPDTWRYSDVAFLLWGSNPWTNPMQAADWADRKIAQLVKEGELEPRNDPSTPAPKKDQIKGSKKNKKGSASGKAGGIKFSDSTEQAIKNRITEHNEEVAGMASWRKLKASSAKAVVRRGFGAYSTSHRPGVSRQAWGLARLKAFSYLLKNDKPKNPNYRSDNDLLPKEHPRYSAKKEEKMSSQHVEVFDKVVAMSQTLEKQRSITNIENMERQTENRSFTFAAVEERNNDDKNTLLFTGYASVFDKPYGVRDSRGP
jgi:hypothetical protein